MSNNIEGKVVVITGASSGLGEATARLLSSQGAIVALGARRIDRIASLADELTANGGKALAMATDVTRCDQVKRLVDAAVQTYGHIDVMINNAGLMPHSPLERLKIEDWDRMVDVNLKGVLYGIAAALPHMQRQKAGHIVNVSSVSGKIGTPHMSSYCATKFALNGLSESLYHELKPLGIHVSVICPGPVRTNFRVLYDHLAPKPPSFMVLSVDEVSRAVIRAIERRKFEVIIPRWLALACLVKALMPSFFRLVAARVLRLRSTDPESRTGNQDREIQTRQ